MRKQKDNGADNLAERSLRMMQAPRTWYSFLLPLQHLTRREPNSPMKLLGFMIEDRETGQAEPVVYLGCIYFASMGLKLDTLATERYDSLEQVVSAGWRVN